MKFYTNVQMVGNDFLVRGYENGERFTIREQFQPTLFVPCKKRTKFKTLEGEYVQPIKPGTVRDTREFIKKYDGVENFKIYGNRRYIYQYMSVRYPEERIEYDIKKINLVTIDIEVQSENGFPTVEKCDEEMLCITLQNFSTKLITTFGIGSFKNNDPNVTYIACENEYDLLNQFLGYWEQDIPDVVTGWNCQLYDIPYLAKRITRVLGEKASKR